MKIAYTAPVVILFTWMLLAIIGPWLPLSPNAVDLSRILVVSDQQSWLGYDDLGRPLWDRLVMGAGVSFAIAISVVSISALMGSVLGAAGGYVGGRFDHVLTRIIDIFLAFPGILLAIALAGILGPGINNLVIALTAVGWVGFARLARSQVLSLKQREHVLAAQALGAGQSRIIGLHLLPLALAPLLVEATFGIASVVIAEAGLSFLGLGVQAPMASWGSMIRDGARFMLVAPHFVLLPGVTLMLVVLAVNMAGDRLRDRLDVKTRQTDR